MKYIDLTHSFTNDMPVYPGDPASQLTQIATIEKDGFVDHEIKSGMHVGTHMDAPLHMLEGGSLLSEIPLQRFFGRSTLIDARGQKDIGADLISDAVQKGNFLLVLTGWSAKYHEPNYYETFPELSEEFAREAVKRGVSAVGLDTPSPDKPPFSIHKILLGGGVLIIENLVNLEQLIEAENFDVVALPVKYQTDGAPVRVVARIDS